MNGITISKKFLANIKKRSYLKKKIKLRKKNLTLSTNPLGGRSWQAKGLVLEKIEVEAKQPNSAKRKCVKIQLFKNKKIISAFAVGDKAITKISEHDTVFIEGIGGMKGKSYGDLPGIKYKVISVNGKSLNELIKKK